MGAADQAGEGKVPNLRIEDVFFLYVIYRHNKKQARNFLSDYARFFPNRAKVVRELNEIELLLSDATDDVGYTDAFEHLMVRKMVHEENYGEKIFSTKEELEEYANFLLFGVNLNLNLKKRTYSAIGKKSVKHLENYLS
jgi:hypothetical protein